MKQAAFLAPTDPGRLAVQYGNDRVSYARFSADVTDLAAWLRGRGVLGGQRAGIAVAHSYWAWVAHLAAMRLGCTVATLTHKYREEVAAAGGLDVSVGGRAQDDLPAMRVIPFAPKTMAPLSTQLAIPSGTGADESGTCARLVFTSGTTGRPKAVLWENAALNRRIALTQRIQKIDANSVVMVLLGMDSSAGIRYPMAVWQAGGCVILRPFDPKTGWTITAPSALGATTLLVTSPQSLKDAVSNVRNPWPGRERRTIVVAGGRLPLTVREVALKTAGSTIGVAYGATETGSISTGNVSLFDRHPGAVGFAVEGASVEVVDANGARLKPGDPGVVRTRTDHMVHAYTGLEEVSSEKPFREGWFYPGDEGILFPDGLLAITGRLSETLNLMGVKYSTPEFEADLTELPNVCDLAAVMVPGPKGEILVIAVTCDDPIDPKTLFRQLRSRIPATVPFELVRLKSIPRNAMGKVERSELRAELAKFL